MIAMYFYLSIRVYSYIWSLFHFVWSSRYTLMSMADDKEYKREYDKQYKLQHQDKIKEQRKIYAETHKEQIKERQTIFYDKNKETIA